jgi:hypothetical protein
MHAVELVLGIGWAAFWIYWLVTTLTSKRSRLANAAKHFDDDQLRALVCLIALINLYNRLNGITHQPAGDYTPGQWGLRVWRIPWSRSRVRRSLLAPQAG